MGQLHFAHGQVDAALRVMIDGPRAGDAIGGALRGVYARERALPADMLELLAALDRMPARHR